MKKEITLLLTGGHVTPAIATIEEIRSRFPGWKLIFVGRKHSLEGKNILSEEYRLIHELGIPFFPITAGRLKRDGGLSAVTALGKIPIGFVQAMLTVVRFRPAVIVTFGGYVALPVAMSAKLFGIPVVTHEQTTRPGLANRLIARIATRTCVSFPETKTMLGDDVVLTGLPLRRAVLTKSPQKPFDVPDDKPILFVVGGSTGSVSVNAAVFAALPVLLQTYIVVHQVGRLSEQTSQTVADKLTKKLAEHYIHRAYFSAVEYSWAMHNSSIVIGRSGANTVMEIALAAKTAICIPLPWAAENEQFHNAVVLTRGGSVILPQDELTAESLIRTVNEVYDSREERSRKAKELSGAIPKDGAKRFVDVIEHILSPKTNT